MRETLGVPLVVDVLGDVEADAVLLQEGDVEHLGLEVVSVVVGVVRTVGQERQLYVSLGEITVETAIVVERILHQVTSVVTEY